MFTAQHIPYASTGILSKLLSDYLSGEDALKNYYAHPAELEGIKAAIVSRKSYSINRVLLHELLTEQYINVSASDKVKENIALLQQENTFTVCTAHQPNIFTGRLYFIYKIVHAIKTAAYLKQQMPDYNFVPVYYMGSEDADLKELGEVYFNGAILEWHTHQQGAVGRMKVDDALMALIDRVSNEIKSEPFGEKLILLLKHTYTKDKPIEVATFELVHQLFHTYGLLIVLPDDAEVKMLMKDIFKKELTESFSYKILQETIASFPNQYAIQAKGRDINLFYLKDDVRERIEKTTNGYRIHNTTLTFSEEEMIKELDQHSERFSPNVILRPLLQELLLPNIIFIGGGGELSYWLELKKIFEAAGVSYPVLILRNSFLIIEEKLQLLLDSLSLNEMDFFDSSDVIKKKYLSNKNIVYDDLTEDKINIEKSYDSLQKIAANADPTLEKHVLALKTKALKRIAQVEQKMLRARKKRFEAEMRKIDKIKQRLFPQNNLQERIENFIPYYAKYGDSFVQSIYDVSQVVEQQFCILKEK